MKALLLTALMGLLSLAGAAQVKKVSLQASGLTCSMCSKAVLSALQEVSFVEKVQVDIKNQKYNMTFRNSDSVDLDALVKAVEDAGFSVAGFEVTADVNSVTVQKDQHVRIGRQYFHFLNAAGQQLNGTAVFSIVDKQFTTQKAYKKYSAMSKMECVQTGRAAKCCVQDDLTENTRIYHAII